MKKWIHASTTKDLYDDFIFYKRDPDESISLGTAAMTGIESLAIFEDDDATQQELADALVNYMDKYYILNEEQRNYIREMV